MNINDLPAGSYQVDSPQVLPKVMNINSLKPGSYTIDGKNPVKGPMASFFGKVNPNALSKDLNNTVGGAVKGIGNYVKDTAKDMYQGTQSIENNISQGSQVAKQPGNPVTNMVKGAGQALLNTAGDAAGMVAAPITQAVKPVVGGIEKGAEAVQNAVTGGKTASFESEGASTLAALAQKYPNRAHDIQSVANILGLVVGGGSDAAGTDVGTPAEDVVGKVKDSVASSPENIASKATKMATEAVDPEMTKAKLGKAYAEVATKGRPVETGGAVTPQKLGIDDSTEGLGSRLKDVLTSKDPVKNLQSISKAFKSTEADLSAELENDKTPADLKELSKGLESLKAKIPGEFDAIKDSKAVYNHVVDFAKRVVSKADASMNGVRDARTEFDAQAKSEYPSAFKNGTVDTSVPAGRAIKMARDFMNNYLYNTAQEGSRLQSLVGREADLYNATDRIAPKAAELEGKTSIGKTVDNLAKQYPKTATAVKVGLGGAAYETAKKLGVPLP